MKTDVLLVEDDIDLNSTIVKFLTLKGFAVDSVFDGQDAIEKIYEKQYSIILLDVKLPVYDGFEVAKKVREFSTVPIIFLTSLNSQNDIEKGFVSGADDYITKPFSLNELYLRINAIVKRLYHNEEKIIISKNIYFNPKDLILYIDNKAVELTVKETKLLALFLQNPNKVLTKDEIFDYLYEYDQLPNEASLRVFINKLRNLIGKEKIHTIKGVGYKYA